MSTPETFTPRPSVSHRSRAELLERNFLSFLRLLEGQQGLQQMPPGFLPDYQALGWVVQRDGTTQLTPAGHKVAQALKSARHGQRFTRGAA
jgi:hypothetical protein